MMCPPPVDNLCARCGQSMGLLVYRRRREYWLFDCDRCYGKNDMGKKFYVKHEDVYFVKEKKFEGGGRMVEWHKDPGVAQAFNTLKEAKATATYLREGPRQFAGIGTEARVVSRRTKCRE